MTDKLIPTANQMSLRTWLRLLTCTRIIENKIRTQLTTSFDITLPRFDVMAQLYRYPDGLRMGEISQLLMVTGGNITGIIDQLEQEGLVQRVTDPNDRRAYIVRLTEQGKEIFADMAQQHSDIVNNLLKGLSPQEKEELHQLLSILRDSLQEKSE